MKTIRVSNDLDPDQDRHFVGPDLGPVCKVLEKKNGRRQNTLLARKVFISEVCEENSYSCQF